MGSRVKAWWGGLAAGVVPAVVGVSATVGTATRPNASFGWFASEPLSETFWVVTPALAVWAFVCVVGLLVAAFCGGGLDSRRQRSAGDADEMGV